MNMKMIVVFFILFVMTLANASDSCQESSHVKLEDVSYRVDTDMPKHLKGATITVTQVDGKTSTVPAEKFKVVPRKQQFVVGQNQVVSQHVICKSNSKNMLIGEVRKDVTDLDATSNGSTAEVHANKALVPGLNYFPLNIGFLFSMIAFKLSSKSAD
jgi:hypothetical protein